MKTITIEDCKNLKNKFDQYCETAEQHEFIALAMLDVMLTATLETIEKDGEIKNQKKARAMFRLVLRTIGENTDDYQEGSAE